MDSPQWLDPLEQQTWRRLGALLNLLPGLLEAQLQQDAGITHYEYWVLAMLSEAPRRTLRMSQLAAWTNASPSRLSHVVNRLELRGWLTRVPVPGDGRGQAAVLTDAGWELLRDTAPHHVTHVRSLIFDHLTTGEVESLDAILGTILSQVDPGGEFGSPAAR